MNLYAESSAVLAWLLDESSAVTVRRHLAASEITVSSDLTLIECDRVLLRAVAHKELTEAEAADRRALIWPPPLPTGKSCALHLRLSIGLLSLDDRVRKSAKGLGVGIVPA